MMLEIRAKPEETIMGIWQRQWKRDQAGVEDILSFYLTG
jgi:hypothetical protein